MEAVMRAVEATGTIDEHGVLHLDQPMTTVGPGRVRVLLLMADNVDSDEQEWLRAAARNPAFDFLNDSVEDIYTRETGNLSTMKGNVVLIPFPFDDLTTTKVRPVVCLTDPVELHPLMTLSTTLTVRELGALPVATHQHVITALHRLFTIS